MPWGRQRVEALPMRLPTPMLMQGQPPHVSGVPDSAGTSPSSMLSQGNALSSSSPWDGEALPSSNRAGESQLSPWHHRSRTPRLDLGCREGCRKETTRGFMKPVTAAAQPPTSRAPGHTMVGVAAAALVSRKLRDVLETEHISSPVHQSFGEAGMGQWGGRDGAMGRQEGCRGAVLPGQLQEGKRGRQERRH